METLVQTVVARKAELDALRARAPGGLSNLEHSHDLELTFTSNAIEGNTLTAVETTLVIEQGLTVAGKPEEFDRLLYERLDATLIEMLRAVTKPPPTRRRRSAAPGR